MNHFKLGIALIVMILLCSCQVSAQPNVQVNGLHAKNSALELTIASYFQTFNEINQWSTFATDDFVKRVYEWCSGDRSGNKSIAEMKKIYAHISENTLDLVACTIDKIDEVSDTEVHIYVTRKWENEETDQTAYSIIKVNGEWKFDNRF